ncbi:MAG TPA: hypothetical protein VFV27_05725 [Nevskiaceae bacterium]|nr:hypothetical protein [Nevskiaceae bacterium]
MPRSSLCRPAPVLLALGALLGGCASGFEERRSLVLAPADLDAWEIRHEAFDGCLLRQQTPAFYRVERSRYQLSLRVLAGDAASPPQLEVAVSGEGALRLEAEGVEVRRDAARDRLRLIPGERGEEGRLTLRVQAGEALVGEERIGYHTRRCTGLRLGARPARS